MELTEDEHAVVQVLRDMGDERLATTGAVARRLGRPSDETQSLLDALVAKGAVIEHNAGTWNFKGSDADDIQSFGYSLPSDSPPVNVQGGAGARPPHLH